MRSMAYEDGFRWITRRWQAVLLLFWVNSGAVAAATLEPAAMIVDVVTVGSGIEVQWLQLADQDIPADTYLVVRTAEGDVVSSTPVAANPSDVMLQGPFTIAIASFLVEKGAGVDDLQRRVAIEDLNGNLLSPVFPYALLPETQGDDCVYEAIGGVEHKGVALISEELEALLDSLSYDDLETALQALLPHHALACEIEGLLAHLAADDPVGLAELTLISSRSLCSVDDCSYFWHATIHRSPGPGGNYAQVPVRPETEPGFVEGRYKENGGRQFAFLQAVGDPLDPGYIYTLPALLALDGRVEVDLTLRRQRGPTACADTADAVFAVEHQASVSAEAVHEGGEGEAGSAATHRAVFAVDGLTILDTEVEAVAYTTGAPRHETNNNIEASRAARLQASSFVARLDLHAETNALAAGNAWSNASFTNPFYEIVVNATATCASPETANLEVSSNFPQDYHSTLLRRWPRAH